MPAAWQDTFCLATLSLAISDQQRMRCESVPDASPTDIQDSDTHKQADSVWSPQVDCIRVLLLLLLLVSHEIEDLLAS